MEPTQLKQGKNTLLHMSNFNTLILTYGDIDAWLDFNYEVKKERENMLDDAI